MSKKTIKNKWNKLNLVGGCGAGAGAERVLASPAPALAPVNKNWVSLHSHPPPIKPGFSC